MALANVLILGAGQLARMMALAAKPLNIEVAAYDVDSKKVINPLCPQHVLGDLADGINDADVITSEFEHIDHHTLDLCQASGKLFPSADAIKIGGDRRLEKVLLEQAKVANAPHCIINNKAEFEQAVNSLKLPIIFKSALAGYDGKGQWRLTDKTNVDQLWAELEAFIESSDKLAKQAIIAEQMISFQRELSVIGARGHDGKIKVYPLTENHHTNGVLSVSLARSCDQQLQQQATDAFEKLVTHLNYVGVLAIEFFQVGNQLLVNEIAPRVHNSGHWTQQGADTCQFENHIRAVCNLPLGSTALVRPTAMVNVLGIDELPQNILTLPSLAIHWYGKTKRTGRKMGHINLCGNSDEALIMRLTSLAKLLPTQNFPSLADYIKRL